MSLGDWIDEEDVIRTDILVKINKSTYEVWQYVYRFDKVGMILNHFMQNNKHNDFYVLPECFISNNDTQLLDESISTKYKTDLQYDDLHQTALEQIELFCMTTPKNIFANYIKQFD